MSASLLRTIAVLLVTVLANRGTYGPYLVAERPSTTEPVSFQEPPHNTPVRGTEFEETPREVCTPNAASFLPPEKTSFLVPGLALLLCKPMHAPQNLKIKIFHNLISKMVTLKNFARYATDA